LPGIAGIVLTMGMAVDANVLIYERIREESATAAPSLPRSTRASARHGDHFRRQHDPSDRLADPVPAGLGPVRGFAVTLGVGIVTSFFTAVMVTRLIVVTWLKAARPKAARPLSGILG
jgi:preprotein translocase subunit SecD